MTITFNGNNISNSDESKNKFSEFLGMWKDRDISQESIREQAWKWIVLDASLFTYNLKDFRFIDGLELV